MISGHLLSLGSTCEVGCWKGFGVKELEVNDDMDHLGLNSSFHLIHRYSWPVDDALVESFFEHIE